MKIDTISLSTWRKNHSVDHKDKWLRELYPFHVFREIDFNSCKINIRQEVVFNEIIYYVTISDIILQANGKYKATFDVVTNPLSSVQSWKSRDWSTTFQLIYTQDFYFISVYTKKEDPSRLLADQFKRGNFIKIIEKRSLPLSDFLFRALLLELSEKNYPGGHHGVLFNSEINSERLGDTPGVRKSHVFVPIYSLERQLWITYAFTEERAHIIASYAADQCEKLIVVYCNPTFTFHHRCRSTNTTVISLYEYAASLSSEVRLLYEPHVQFLQNHLNEQQILDADKLWNEIENPSDKVYEIKQSDLMEALGILRIMPVNELDFFHALAAVNLINAFISRRRKMVNLSIKEKQLFRNMYSFKAQVADMLSKYSAENDMAGRMYIAKDLLLIVAFGVQFSFHSIPMTEALAAYKESASNTEITWSGKRLQPIAPLLLHYSRALRQKK